MRKQKKELNGRSAVAVADANIALINYWAKPPEAMNLPAVGSISLTLDSLKTETRIRFDKTLTADIFKLNGKIIDGRPLKRITAFLDTVVSGRSRLRAQVASTNNFPTG